MHSVRHRLLDIVSTTVLAFLIMAGATAVSTILRDVVCRPVPRAKGLQVTASPIYLVQAPVLLTGQGAYYAHGELEDTFQTLVPASPLPENLTLTQRSFDRVLLRISGTIDFAPCWDWNTKAIFLSVVARYRTRRAEVNEVTVLDAMLRDGEDTQSTCPPPRGPHDDPSVRLDHRRRQVHLRDSYKYYLNDLYQGTLDGTEVEVVLRYQIMSYSGWAPLREDVLGGRTHIRLPTRRLPWGEH